ncbi:hypothetical protein [uncultured Desulfovibrio sp.]|nr:hypothetical protein [uncultured Desulfovibrio sp.]
MLIKHLESASTCSRWAFLWSKPDEILRVMREARLETGSGPVSV